MMSRHEFENAVRKLIDASGLDSTEIADALYNLADEANGDEEIAV